MTDERPATTGDPIDQAIDRAVRELVAREAPADLRARVLARLEQPEATRTWWSPGRLVAAAAAVAVVAIATYLAWPSRPAPLAEPASVVAEARRPAALPPAAPAPAEAIAPDNPAPERGTAVVAATRPPSAASARRAAAAVVDPEAYEFRSPREVARLDAPEPIGIDPMPPDAIDFTPVTVEPLVFERLAIEPMGGSR